MRMPSKRCMILAAAVVLVALSFLVGRPEPAQAQFGVGFGGINFHFGPGYRGPRNRHRGPKRNGGESDAGGDDRGRGAKDEKIVASKGAPNAAEQAIALRKVAMIATTTDVGTAKDLKEAGRTVLNERERDYTAKINDIIKKFTDRQTRNSTPGDVTAAAIENSLDKAFKEANLDAFGKFNTESWTSERLRVRTLEVVDAQVDKLFNGNTQGNTPMSQLDAIILKAAKDVYGRIFEASELLASNKSSSLFMQRLYQTHGSLVSDELRESVDDIITRASLTALRPFELMFKRAEDIGYAYRYRGQRIIFDCLSENVEDVTKAETRIATIDDIRRRVAKTSNEVCSEWLVNQFGSDRENIKPQRPVAMRAIWAVSGPSAF